MVVFRRREAAAGRLGLLAVGCGGLAFLLASLLLLVLLAGELLGLGTRPHPASLLAVGMALVFGVLGLLAMLPVPRRLRIWTSSRDVVHVDGDGLTVTGLFALPWSEIAEVRLVKLGNPAWAGPAARPALEVVPRGRELLARRPWPDRAYDALRRGLGRLLRRPSLREAGAFHLELELLEADWRDVVAAMEQHRPVRRL